MNSLTRLARDFDFVNYFFQELPDISRSLPDSKDESLTYRCHIPDNFDITAISADIKDNVLTITVPRKKTEARKVEIKVT